MVTDTQLGRKNPALKTPGNILLRNCHAGCGSVFLFCFSATFCLINTNRRSGGSSKSRRGSTAIRVRRPIYSSKFPNLCPKRVLKCVDHAQRRQVLSQSFGRGVVGNSVQWLSNSRYFPEPCRSIGHVDASCRHRLPRICSGTSQERPSHNGRRR